MLSALSVGTDLRGCSRCSGVRSVSLGEFRERVRGRAYRELLGFHLRTHAPPELEAGRDAALALLPERARRAALELADEFLRRGRGDGRGRDREVWGADCADVLDRVVERTGPLLREGRGRPRADRLFDTFEVVTLSLALAATEEPELRERMGIESGGFLRRWWPVVAAGSLAATSLLVGDGPLGEALLWTAGGILLLPPVARGLARRLDREGEG